MNKLTLVGSDHIHPNCDWLYHQIELTGPDCITLEQEISAASFFLGLVGAMERKELVGKPEMPLGEFTSCIQYAKRQVIPVYCIDWYRPYKLALNTNILERLNPTYPHDLSHRLTWTQRNRIMAFAINYYFRSGKANILHCGGSGHYDSAKCVPIQQLVIADQIEIVDAIAKTRNRIK